MADHFLADALAAVRRTLALAAEPTDDARLLARFARDRDEAAFAELVARHGPAVWAACRRGTRTAADAEDAFQATFLVLARRADRVRRAASVGGWLFRVAVRLSARTRTRANPPVPDRPLVDPAPDPADRAAWRDLVAVLDAELAGLPDAVRAALVSCYYEGLTQDEAARRLGWKVRTVRARVARGRKLLRTRLARRGVDLGAALAAAAVALDAPAVVPPVSLTRSVGGAVSELVGYGLALTGRSARLPLAVAAAVAAVAGTGYVIATNTGLAGGGSGSPAVASVPTAPPAALSEPPARPQLDFDPAAVYDRAVDGCVYIVRETDAGPVEGTGALIDREQRLVLTTYRVVGDSDVVSVQFPYRNPDGVIDTNRKEYARSATGRLTPMGRVVHRDKARDLALVKLDRLGRHARSLELAEPGIPKAVLHIGAGTGELFPMTVRRVLSADAPAMTLSGGTNDSGGPLVDRDGKLVGVVVGEAAGPADQKGTRAIGVAEVRAFLAEEGTEPPAVPASAEPPAAPIVEKDDPPPPRLTVPGDFGPPIYPIPTEFDGAARDLYAKCVKSTVFIVAPLPGGMTTGSGSLIDVEKRYVLTNCHVVGDDDQVYVQFPVRLNDGALLADRKTYLERIPAGKALKGKVLYRDKTRDLALLQLERLPPDTTALPLAKKSAEVFDKTWHIGSPGEVNQMFGATRGQVYSVGNEDAVFVGTTEALRIKGRKVTVTNPIKTGDCGGPLISRRGYLVGVTESDSVGGRTRTVHPCIDVTEVLAFLKEKKVIIKDPTDDSTKPKTGDAPSKAGASPVEDAADLALKLAKVFNYDEDKAYYESKLKQVIAKYPGTAAAKEAQKLLIKSKIGDTPPEPERGTKNPPKDESSADERAAAAMLQRAKLFAEADDKAYYAKRLHDVITKYPGTAAAKEAKKLLDGLKK